MRNAAELFVDCLAAVGIDTVYGVPGEETSNLILALDGSSSVEFVLTRHEQGAAFMAAVHGRITGKPAACLATLGPGATNLVTGVADAQLDYVPLLAITAQGDRARMQTRESHQIVDLEALFAPVTKQSRTILTPDTIPGAVAEAARQMMGPRPGAVHLSLPEDVAKADTDAEPVSFHGVSMPAPSPDALKQAVDALQSADAPIILAGGGILRAGAADAVRKLAKALNIPVATSFFGMGVLPPDHPLWLPAVGLPFADHIDGMFHESDAILAVGFDPIEYAPTDLGRGTPIIHLSDVSAARDVGWTIAADVVGDIGQSLEHLSRETQRTWPDRSDADRVRQAAFADVAPQNGDRLNPDAVISEVQRQLRDTDQVISGVGTHKMKVADRLHPSRPGQVIIANGLAGMGLALPGAIAAARLQRHGGMTLAIAGDGEFFMNLQEMETARRLGHPFVVLLLEDGGLGLIEAKEDQDLGQHADHGFGTPDWDHLAAAFDWRHDRAETLEALRNALDNARVETDRPVLITVPIRYEDALKDRTD